MKIRLELTYNQAESLNTVLGQLEATDLLLDAPLAQLSELETTLEKVCAALNNALYPAEPDDSQPSP